MKTPRPLAHRRRAGSFRSTIFFTAALLATALTAGTAAPFIANDPFFYPGRTPAVGGPGDASNLLFPGQWYLRNQMPASALNNPAIDVNITAAWARGLTGAGVVIGIVDSGVQIAHADLAPNIALGLSHDFVDGDGNPSPASDSRHGTAAAGVAAARGGNGIGITGAAPFAQIAGLRILPTDTDPQLSLPIGLSRTTAALEWRNDAIAVKSHSYTDSSPYVSNPAGDAARAASAAQGVINVYAAGNSRSEITQSSAPGSAEAIVVSALGSNGKFASYTSYGASMTVTAPSSNPGIPPNVGLRGVNSTDLIGTSGVNNGTDANDFADADYTRNFGGTSSAAPLVAGILALGKQANLNLDTRLAKHLLARTSRVVDPTDNRGQSDRGWRTNAAGFHFNQQYGFGLIDADAFTRAAAQFRGVTPRQTETVAPIPVNRPIPDQDSVIGVSRQFSVQSSTPLEEVKVTLNITHPNIYNLWAELTSPSGYRSRLKDFALTPARGPIANLHWDFVSNAFWGENPRGTWKLTVFDIASDTATEVGTWDSYSAAFNMGAPVEGFVITGIRFVAGDVVVTFPAIAGRTYRLEHKQKVTDPAWLPVVGATDLTAAANGSAQLTDPGATSVAQRFYRVRMVP